MALTLSHYRFGIDELAENTHGWHAAEDANPASGVIGLDTNFLLRFTVQANATGLSNVDNEFQFRINGGTWTNITTTSSFVRAVAVTPLTNGGNCTKRLSGTGTFESSGAGQTEDGTSGGAANDIVASGNSECECGLILRSADLTGGETIEFRLTRDGGTLLDTYAVVPTLLMPSNLVGVGIASGEAFGTAVVTPGDVALTGVSISSGEAFGTGAVASAGSDQDLTGVGIASTEAFGTAVLTTQTDITGVGIASAEALGTAVLTTGPVNLTGVGIASGEAFGTGAVTPGEVALSGVAIASAEVFGAGVITTGAVALTGVGISSGEAFGTATVAQGAADQDLTGVAIASGETFGTGALTTLTNLFGLGVVSGEAFGTGLIGNYASQALYGPDGSVGNALVDDTPGTTHQYSYIPGTTHNG